MHYKDLIGGALATLFARYVFAPLLGNAIQKWLIKTERDLILYNHYKKHHARKGHKPKRPHECQDNGCKRFYA